MTFPDWSDEQIDRLNLECERIARVMSAEAVAGELTPGNLTERTRDLARSALRAAGIVPNGARWRPVAEYDSAAGHEVLARYGEPVRTAVAYGDDDGKWYLAGPHAARIAVPSAFMPFPAPPTTEAT